MTRTTIECVSDEKLSAYLDGDLDAEGLELVQEHLAKCPVCRGTFEELQSLKGELADFRAEELPDEMWKSIEEALLTVKKQGKENRYLSKIVPIAIALAASVALVLLYGYDASSPSPKDPVPKTERMNAVFVVERAEATYRRAINVLEAAVEKERPELTPETMAIVEQSLKEVETAIERSRRAVKADPQNVEAMRTLLAAYEQKVDLLTGLVEHQI